MYGEFKVVAVVVRDGRRGRGDDAALRGGGHSVAVAVVVVVDGINIIIIIVVVVVVGLTPPRPGPVAEVLVIGGGLQGRKEKRTEGGE